MNSRRIIDCVMRGDNEEATRILRESLDRKQVEATLEQSVAIAYDAIHESDNAADAAAAAAEQGLSDPALDPATTKEFFLKTFEVNGTPVTLKKLGLGASAPISSFIEGERWEMFMTPQQATREVKKYITSGQYSKDADAREAAIAAAEKEAEKEEKSAVKKESVELDEQMTFQFGTTEQASKFADEAVRERLAAATDQYKSNYGDHMVELSSNSGSTGSPTMAHKSLVKLMKKHGGKLHSTNEGPRIKKVFKEYVELDEKLRPAPKRKPVKGNDEWARAGVTPKSKGWKQGKAAIGIDSYTVRGAKARFIKGDEIFYHSYNIPKSGGGDYKKYIGAEDPKDPGSYFMMDMDRISESVQLDEKIKGLENKSEKSGIAYGILKKVYDRGMEAWRSGHRPGATQHQWAFARVNSFITGGKTRTTADKDLWSQHKGKKESVQIDEAKKTYEFKDFKTADAFAKACDEIVDSSDLTVNKKKNEVTVDFRRRSDEMIIDSLAKDYES